MCRLSALLRTIRVAAAIGRDLSGREKSKWEAFTQGRHGHASGSVHEPVAWGSYAMSVCLLKVRGVGNGCVIVQQWSN